MLRVRLQLPILAWDEISRRGFGDCCLRQSLCRMSVDIDVIFHRLTMLFAANTTTSESSGSLKREASVAMTWNPIRQPIRPSAASARDLAASSP